MSTRRPKRSAADIIELALARIERVQGWTATDTEATFAANLERMDAVERNFIAIGEAVKDLAAVVDLPTLDPHGPWAAAARFRDFLAHNYGDDVIRADLWITLKSDLPELAAALHRVRNALQG